MSRAACARHRFQGIGLPAAIVRDLGIKHVRLLTNNARKVEGLQKAGVDVVREPLEIPPTAASLPYLRTKATKMDHLLNLESEQPESGSETDPTQSIDQQLE